MDKFLTGSASNPILISHTLYLLFPVRACMCVGVERPLRQTPTGKPTGFLTRASNSSGRDCVFPPLGSHSPKPLVP